MSVVLNGDGTDGGISVTPGGDNFVGDVELY